MVDPQRTRKSQPLPEPLICIENAGFSHGDDRIFNRVNLTVSKGETYCLLGPNGCGKTTLLDAILGIHRLDRGKISIGGANVASLAPRHLARRMAYVPQTHRRFFSFTVMEMLLMGRAPYTRFYDAPGREDRIRVETLLDSLDLIHLKDRDYTRLSGGETQLVMILRALVQDTPVIVMDEPTAHLDFRNELMVLETITRLVRENGLTMVMATHFPNHAFFFEKSGLPVSVGFMGQGRIHSAGSPSRALIRENLSRFFGVDTAVVTCDVDGKAHLKQVIPLHTLDSRP